jgi:hypothetical protein
LPPALRGTVDQQLRRGVPLRTISSELTAAGHPVHRDALHRHGRDHLPPADVHEVECVPSDAAAGLTVAAALAGELRRWPDLAAKLAARLRAEGLDGAADIVIATTPETTRAALVAARGTPSSELMEARLVLRAMRRVFGTGYPDVARALARACRDLGGDDLADALDDLAASVEGSPSQDERDREVQARALRAAQSVAGWSERGHALGHYAREYGDDRPLREHLVSTGAIESAAVGGGGAAERPARRVPSTTREKP